MTTTHDEETTADVSADDHFVPAEKKTIPLLGIEPTTMALGIHSFDDLPMHALVKEAVAKIGWAEPTPVQKLCLPYTLRGRDVAGFAQTGTGKTGVFLLTIASRLLEANAALESQEGQEGEKPEPKTRAIVLAPTRELAMQIEDDAQTVLAHTGISSLAVFGGVDYDKQLRRIKEGVDLIVATPGRLMDYVKKGAVDLKNISIFVCDEADRMFDMGFIEDVEFFLERIPESTQKLLFSATTNEQVKELAFEYLETPEYVSVNPEVLTPERIEQHAIHCHAKDKLKVIMGLLNEHQPVCSIIFTNTKLTAEWLHYKLVGNGFEADLITGDLPQKKRIKLIQTIKEGQLKVLIATDVASRGLHISRVTHVYNFDLPDDAPNYVHRIGRTARAGARGNSYSLVCDDYGHNLAAINAMLGETIAMQSEWYDEKFLKIEDKAGNPFEGRLRSRAERDRDDQVERSERARGGGSSGGGGGNRPDRGPRGPRDDRGDDGRDRKGASRTAQNGGGGGGGGRPQQQRNDREQGDEGGKRRRRGKGGQGGGGDGRQEVQGQQRGAQQGGQQGRGGRPDGQRQDQRPRGPQDGGRGRPQQPQVAAAAAAPKDGGADKNFGGMVKRFFRTLFGKK